MPTEHQRINITPSDPFSEWLDSYAAKRGISRAQAVVELATPAIRAAGFEGQIMLQRGKYQRELKRAIARADELTDYGKNDPTED